MTDKLIMTTADRDYFLKCIKTLCTGSHSDSTRTAQTLQDMLQSLPVVSEPENNDVVELYGMKDGIQVHLGQAPTPARMKAKEIVTSVFGHFDEHGDMDDGDAALCFSCMTELIDYMQKLSKPSTKALTQQIGMEAADFAGWLVEHVEKEIIYEERLLGWLGKWLKHRSPHNVR